MSWIDWIVVVLYIAGIVGMGAWIGRRQRTQDDYYLGGRAMGAWPVALSVMATQVSAISLISAPAFIARRGGGGLVWLQYEFAIPLAMIGILAVLVPRYHRCRITSIYEYLEARFGRPTRAVVSAVFLISRSLGAGVMLLATGIVSAVCLGLPLPETVLLIGGVAIIYTTIGGIVADIYSDIVQLAVLYAGTLVTITILAARLDAGAWGVLQVEVARLRVFDFRSTGWGDGQTFAFWPMLLGGFFLYLSYYGCDQSQTQRLLTTPTPGGAQRALMLNGLLRFPLVLTYCAVGVLLIPYLAAHPDFSARLAGHPPDFLVPFFLLEHLPAGVLGLIVAGIFAASMSSLDSALNSLSAATWQDFLTRWRPSLAALPDRVQVRLSRALTIGWGVVSTTFALVMIGGSETVLEMINKIGSAFYGPVLAVFLLGMLTRRAGQAGALAGLAAGVGLNLYLWLVHSEDVSWMWWNVAGFASAVLVGGLVGLIAPVDGSTNRGEEIPTPFPSRTVWWLLAAFPLYLAAGWLIQVVLVNR